MSFLILYPRVLRARDRTCIILINRWRNWISSRHILREMRKSWSHTYKCDYDRTHYYGYSLSLILLLFHLLIKLHSVQIQTIFVREPNARYNNNLSYVFIISRDYSLRSARNPINNYSYASSHITMFAPRFGNKVFSRFDTQERLKSTIALNELTW